MTPWRAGHDTVLGVIGVRTVLAIPAYNEEQALPPLLARAAAVSAFDQVLVVDDGSADDTVGAASRFVGPPPVTVVRHGRNRGLGAAMRTAIQHLAKSDLHDDDVIVTMDGDNTHDPALVPDMRAALAAGTDVVVASRYAPGGREYGLSWHRRLLSRGASTLLRQLRPVPGVRDYSCGYRAYRLGMLRRALDRYGPDGLIVTDGFACMAELLLRLHALGARCTEVPMELHYERKGGPSKMRVARTVGGYLQLLRAVPGPRAG